MVAPAARRGAPQGSASREVAQSASAPVESTERRREPRTQPGRETHHPTEERFSYGTVDSERVRPPVRAVEWGAALHQVRPHAAIVEKPEGCRGDTGAPPGADMGNR